jgi:hypothetical protein
MFEFASVLVALFLVVSIACPQLFERFKKQDDKKVGSSYWGVYNGTPTEDLHAHRVTAPKPGRSQKVVAGSFMYAGRK